MKQLLMVLILISTFLCTSVPVGADDYTSGIAAFQNREYEEALNYLNRAKDTVEGFYVHYLIGLCYLYLEEGELAREHFLYSLELDPSFYLGYINLARAEILLSNYQEGLGHLNTAIYLEENDYNVYHLQGRIYLNLKEWERAMDRFLKAQELAPENVYVLNNLGLSYIYLGFFTKARDVLEKAVEKRPSLPYIYNNLGIVYENLDQLEKALDSYSTALAIDPDHIHAQLNLLRLEERIR